MAKERPVLDSRISITNFKDFYWFNDVIKFWEIKESKPGDNKYSKTDLL